MQRKIKSKFNRLKNNYLQNKYLLHRRIKSIKHAIVFLILGVTILSALFTFKTPLQAKVIAPTGGSDTTAATPVPTTPILDDPCPSGVIYEQNSKPICVPVLSSNDQLGQWHMGYTYDFTNNAITAGSNIFPHQQLTWPDKNIPGKFDSNSDTGPNACLGIGDSLYSCCSEQAGTCDAGKSQSSKAFDSKGCDAFIGCGALTNTDHPNGKPHFQTGTKLTCEQENIHFKDQNNSSMDGKYEHLIYCGKEIMNFCADSSLLRARLQSISVIASVSTLFGITVLDSNAGTNANYVSFYCEATSNSQPAPANPFVWLDIPTQSYCDLHYNIGKSETDGYCTWTPGNGGENQTPKNVVNCSVDQYKGEHPEECSCIFDTSHHVENGNTYTAIGCIPSNLGGVMNIFLTVAIAFASIFALIRMIVGGYEIMTNPAGPEEIAEGKDIIVNAALGLLFVTLCIVILRIIGIQILQINVIQNIFG